MTTPTLSDLLPDFLEHLEVERGRSQRTSKDYEHYLTRFIELAGEISGQDYNLKPGDLTRELIRKYRLRLNRITDTRGHTLAPITQAYHLIALRGFLKYLAQRDIATLDPSLIELPRVVRKQVTFLNYDEVERLLAEIPTDTEIGLRDRAIIELLFSSGLRVSELAGLNRDSINLERREPASTVTPSTLNAASLWSVVREARIAPSLFPSPPPTTSKPIWTPAATASPRSS